MRLAISSPSASSSFPLLTNMMSLPRSDRHCPKCQIAARERWIAARQRELLPTPYAHVVFTLPRRLAPLVLQNKKLLYDLLFRTTAETLLEVARNPLRLGAEIGFFSVLHTWNQKLELHPHVHCVVPAGGLSPVTPAGFPHETTTFFPRRCRAKSFAASSSMRSKRLFRMVSSTSMVTCNSSLSLRSLPPGYGLCSINTGWCT